MYTRLFETSQGRELKEEEGGGGEAGSSAERGGGGGGGGEAREREKIRVFFLSL